MALVVVGSGTKTTDGTKQSLQAITTAGPHRLVVDVNALVGGVTPDIVELTVEQNVLAAGAERQVWSRQFTGGLVVDPIVQTEDFWVPQTATAYIKRIQGTDRGYPWVVLRNDSGAGGAGGGVWKKNTALAKFAFPMKDSVDHVSFKSGLTVTALREIDGGGFAACANSPVEIGTTGVYTIDFAASDLNGTVILFKFSAAGADTLAFTVITS